VNIALFRDYLYRSLCLLISHSIIYISLDIVHKLLFMLRIYTTSGIIYLFCMPIHTQILEKKIVRDMFQLLKHKDIQQVKLWLGSIHAWTTIGVTWLDTLIHLYLYLLSSTTLDKICIHIQASKYLQLY
jgi:hypothetical protein